VTRTWVCCWMLRRPFVTLRDLLVCLPCPVLCPFQARHLY
jgi:hypothetical protein